ncbi:MAG: nucleotidyltransferase family protein [Chitinophagaceae bacterium]|nr:MAG: nucleotidyltransferase family protein [Chitinophagaceae bacterium]
MEDEIHHTSTIGVVILAAGESSRMGEPKQLLPYSGTTLLQHTIDIAQSSRAKPVIVVLGANAGIIQEEVKTDTAICVTNASWREGIASSIRCGVNHMVQANLPPDAVILMVADQPFVTSTLLNALADQYINHRHPVVASKYEETLGTPVLFDKQYWPQLLALKGDEGAKSLIYKNIDLAAFVSFPKGKIDVDTKEDFSNLMDSKSDL